LRPGDLAVMRNDSASHFEAADQRQVREAMTELLLEAAGFVAPVRVEDLARNWLARSDALQTAPDDEALQIADALGMAMDLALFTPSVSGATAFDRLARTRPPTEPHKVAALEALRRAQFRLLRVEAVGKGGSAQLCDLASDETVRLLDENVPPEAVGVALAGRVAPLGDSQHVFAGGVTPLDSAALAVAMGFVRPGARRGLINAQRCAEAIYRHVVRHGTLDIPGLNRPAADIDDDLLQAGGRLDRLAQRWAERDAAHEAEDIQFVRDQTSLENVLALLASAANTREHGRGALSGAYAAIALVQLETLHRRAMAGSGTLGLETVALAVDGAIAAGEIPPRARMMFNELRGRLGAASGTGNNDADLDRLIGRIQALRAKTVEQGCTEQEALAAAEKVAELLDRYGLSLSELDLQQQACEGLSVETERKRTGPVDDCVPVVAAFFDCRVWGETTTSGRLRYVFFGLRADVVAARYLYDLIEQAFETETARFRAGTSYTEAPTGVRRTLTNSFQIGLGRGITTKLQGLRATRETTLRTSSGRDLVVAKADVVAEELARLGLHFRTRSRSGGRRVLRDAFEAGHEAGLGFEYTPGVAHQHH
jgi:hypothetical protein